jgi:hypothetical protein
MQCEHCHAPFTPKHPRAKFCSSRCRGAAWYGQRYDRLTRLKTLLVRAIEEVDVLDQVGIRRKAKRP